MRSRAAPRPAATSTGCSRISSRITKTTSPTARAPSPGLDDALDTLAAQGCRLAVCTNKLERLSRILLDTLGISRRFAAICGQDTFGIQKPDPEILRRTIAAAGGVPGQAVMVGDSGTDIATARAARIPVVAVSFGYSDPPVAQLDPDRLIGHFSELVAAITELVPGPARPARRP